MDNFIISNWLKANKTNTFKQLNKFNKNIKFMNNFIDLCVKSSSFSVTNTINLHNS